MELHLLNLAINMKYVIEPVIFAISIGIMTIIIALISALGKFKINSTQNFFRKHNTIATWTFIFCSIIMSGFLYFQDQNNSNIEENSNLILSQERARSEKKIAIGIKKGIDSSNAKLFNDISIAFAKQGLKIDTLEQTVDKIDNPTTINNYPQTDPLLTLDNNGFTFQKHEGLFDEYNIRFRASSAGLTNIDIETSLLCAFENNKIALSQENLFPDDIKLVLNSTWEIPIKVVASEVLIYIYIYIKGTYTTIDGLKKYSINDLLIYKPKTKTVGMLLKSGKKTILEEIQKYPKNKIQKLLED